MIKDKKAQITIFVIIAMILVVVIIMLFLIFRQPKIIINPEEDPRYYIETCARNALDDASELVEKNGGYIDPIHYKLYKSENYSYLCYNKNYYYPCVVQEPMLLSKVNKEMTSYTRPIIENCFDELKNDLEKKGYSIEMSQTKNHSILIVPKQIKMDIEKDFKITKGYDVKELNKFSVVLTNPIYELVNVANEIISQEARFCTFNTMGFSILYTNYNIEFFTTGDGIKLYNIEDIRSKKGFKFAIRGCVMPAGL